MNTRLAFLLAASAALIACSEDPSPSPGGRPDSGMTEDTGTSDGDAGGSDVLDATLAAIEVEPGQLSVEKGTTATLSVRGFAADGSEIALTDVAWSSSDDAVAEVTPTGTVIANEFGTVTITAGSAGVEGTAEVRVIGAPVARVEVSPRDRQMMIGDTVQMTVTLFDALNAPIEDERAVEFASADVAVVDVDATGLVTAIGGGTTTVSTTVEGISEESTFTVTADAAIDLVTVTPAAASLGSGETLQLMAVASAGGVEQTGVSFTWTSDDVAIAAVDSDGLVTAVGEGSTTIRAGAAGVEGQAAISVTFDFQQVSAGGGHACGLSGGVAYCWGDNAENQLGRAAIADSAPARVETTVRFAQLAAGGFHTCGIATDAKAYCWGRGDEGQLGNSGPNSSATPGEVFGNHDFVAIAAGAHHSCAVDVAGALWCWGSNGTGQIGSAGAGASITQPTSIGTYGSVATGAHHTCAVDAANDGWCWGDNSAGQVGVNMTGSTYSSPAAVLGGFQFDRISAGSSHSCGSTTGGALVCWGANDSGQLGETTTTTRPSPILVSSPVALSRVAAGGAHTCALTSGGVAHCWGSNDAGQLGTGTVGGMTSAPGLVQTALTFSSLSAGQNFTCGVTADGDPLCWGAGPGGGASAPTPVAF